MPPPLPNSEVAPVLLATLAVMFSIFGYALVTET